MTSLDARKASKKGRDFSRLCYAMSCNTYVRTVGRSSPEKEEEEEEEEAFDVGGDLFIFFVRVFFVAREM